MASGDGVHASCERDLLMMQCWEAAGRWTGSGYQTLLICRQGAGVLSGQHSLDGSLKRVDHFGNPHGRIVVLVGFEF